MSEQANHLMKLHAAVNDRCHRYHGTHIGVHLLVHQPEGQSFIPDQSLERFDSGEAWRYILDLRWDAQKTSINHIPLDRDSLHRRCTSPHSACWSACRRCCPCPSPRPLTPSGSTETERAYWKTYMIDAQPKDPFGLWLITKAQYFSFYLSQVFFGLHFFLRSISVLTSLYPHGELCLPLNGGNGVF